MEGVKEVNMKGTWWLTITGWTNLVDLSVTSPTGHSAIFVCISWHIGMLSIRRVTLQIHLRLQSYQTRIK